ncbi:ABC transporter ATP-binding protein [Dyadobacter sediminis]|uniref:ABC transporter ATP-binding protein n=1 Tax=Dyadobacter sediminis TaxID=1493691 RepID=A0A5R9KAD3_9BACT|nr:ABC transporter ATP-binding protein [Dyadobacter sediminis]TLU91748.1 ABC transporter ATP-binding protein [Dyadobacter sediminis]GGC00623.1 ABC transporter [Dyadobacter sediminis]
MKALKYLNQYLWKYKWYLILGIVFTIISNLFGILPAQLVRYALDLVIETLNIYYLFDGASLQSEMYDIFAFSILLYGLLILAMALLKGIFLFLVRQTIIVMSRHIEFDLKNDIYSHYQTLPASFFRRHNTGDLMARISEDVSNVRIYLGPALMYGINLIVLFFLVISYMLTVSSKLTLYVLLPLPVLSVSVYIVNSMIMKRSQAIQKQLSGLSTYVQEAFSGIRVIKSFVQENHSFSNFQKEAEDFKDKSLSLTKVDAFFYPIILLLIGLSNILIIYVGGQEIINGNLTPGNITEFILYVNMLTWPVMALGWTTSQIQRAATSQARINEFLDEKTTLVSEKNVIKNLDGAISFRNVGFIYPDSGIQALDNFDLEVKQGETVAILGTTGSGKSTLAHLLCRLYDPTQGEILIDNIPMKDYDVHAYRRQIGYVPQDVFLFSDSIENNVRFGTLDMPFERIEQAVKDADLYNNIVDFPEGYKTTLGERGITLSGGQKQRLSIARAIARDPKILVLDDCLSAVDTNTENIILNNLKRIMDQRTSVIISHRVSSAKLADRIVVLDDGKIVEQGTHAELMAHNGAYKELYEKQLLAEEV